MFRISEQANGAGRISLLLEGRLVGPWVPDFKAHCERFLDAGLRVSLDCREVTFVDRDGMEVLRDLVSRDVEVQAFPLFLASQLRKEVG